jgi:hypothetical protein
MNKRGRPQKCSTKEGERYGILTVLYTYRRPVGKEKRLHWFSMCKCDCGNITESRNDRLLYGRLVRCGHGCKIDRRSFLYPDKLKIFQLKRRTSIDHIAVSQVFSSTKRGARTRCIEFSLKRDDVRRIINNPCHYCGNTGGNTFSITRFGNKEVYNYNGIDRLDNSAGYTIGNIVPCCGSCNKAKQCMSESEFKAFISRIYNHFILKL